MLNLQSAPCSTLTAKDEKDAMAESPMERDKSSVFLSLITSHKWISAAKNITNHPLRRLIRPKIAKLTDSPAPTGEICGWNQGLCRVSRCLGLTTSIGYY